MKVIVQNTAIEYKDEGNGPILLFLHGWGDSLQTYNQIVNMLTPNYRVIRVDLPGFGGSEVPKNAWDLDKYIDVVSSFVEKINIKADAIVGHSFGGRITIKGCGEGKFKPKKIVLIGSAGLAKRKTVKNTSLTIATKIGNIVSYVPPLYFWREKIKRKLYEKIGSDYYNAGPLKETFVNIIAEDLTEYAKKINIPALLIWGENDTETPLSDGRKLNSLISGSKLVIIDEAGHMVHQEKPDEVVETIKEFL